MSAEQIIEAGTLVGGVVSAYAYLPQIRDMAKAKTANGHSLSAWYLWLLGMVLMLLYAIYINDWILMLLNGIYSICIVAIISLIYKYRNENKN